MTFDISRV